MLLITNWKHLKIHKQKIAKFKTLLLFCEPEKLWEKWWKKLTQLSVTFNWKEHFYKVNVIRKLTIFCKKKHRFMLCSLFAKSHFLICILCDWNLQSTTTKWTFRMLFHLISLPKEKKNFHQQKSHKKTEWIIQVFITLKTSFRIFMGGEGGRLPFMCIIQPANFLTNFTFRHLDFPPT